MAASCQRPEVSIAPMMDVTDRHCRYFLRLLSPDVRLYTEMTTAQAILYGDRGRLLRFDPAEHPVAMQLAGRDPGQLAEAARIAADAGYDEINLNIGCPSTRVRDGCFGVSLMLEPAVVARCLSAMRRAVPVPVTAKIRVGIDEHEGFDFLADFVARLADTGCQTFIVHARKALSSGLSPRANLTVPPLQYELVYRLKAQRPDLRVILNGGIRTIADMAVQLTRVDGAMLGRKAAEDPYFLTEIQRHFFGVRGGDCPPERAEIVRRMCEYARREMDKGARLHHITRHMLGLYRGVSGARAWRRFLADQARQPGVRPDVLLDSLNGFDERR